MKTTLKDFLNENKKIITQKEWFEKQPTDHLLSMRNDIYCRHPKNINDKPDENEDAGKLWYIDKNLLKAELDKRPHRTRAKDKRKTNIIETEILDHLNKQMNKDKKEYKGKEWNEKSWYIDEIMQFLDKELMSSYTLKKFNKKYDYKELDKILKKNFKQEYIKAQENLKK